MQRPILEVMAWPAWEVQILESFLAREPAPLERIEQAVARLTMNYVARHRGADQPAPALADFLPYRDAWAAAFDQSEFDAMILDELEREARAP